jgi:glycerol-3-phosphate dehydrogenase
MLSVAGGKLTTYRRIAHGALARLRAELDLHRLDATPVPLPGAAPLAEAIARLARRFPDVEPSLRAHLAHLYGTLAEDVLAPAADDPELLQRLHPDAPDVAAQALYAGRDEWALGAEDFLRRRTTLALRGLDSADVRARVVALLGAERRPPARA